MFGLSQHRLSRRARRRLRADAEWAANLPGILTAARCPICHGTGYVWAWTGRRQVRCNHAYRPADLPVEATR